METAVTLLVFLAAHVNIAFSPCVSLSAFYILSFCHIMDQLIIYYKFRMDLKQHMID